MSGAGNLPPCLTLARWRGLANCAIPLSFVPLRRDFSNRQQVKIGWPPAMVPAMTFSTARNFFYAGGTWDLSWISWIWENIAPDARARAKLPGPLTGGEADAGRMAEAFQSVDAA